MIEILANQIIQQQISQDPQAFAQWVLAIQQDAADQAILIQTSNVALFPSTPSLGGTFTTRKGVYECIYTDAVPEVGQWRRLSDGSIYAVGSAIPTTL